jgi:hypothetical protein
VHTTTTGEDRCYGVGEPVVKWFISKGVQVANNLFHDVTIIDGNVIEIFGDMGERIDVTSPPAIPPRQVGDAVKLASISQGIQELTKWLFRGVTSGHEINLWVAFQDLLVEICCRQATEDHWRLRVKTLDDLGQSQCTLNMRHPVKVKPKQVGIQRGDESLNVKPWTFQHLEGHVDDSDLETVPLQVFGNANESDRIEFKNRRRRDNITDRPMHDGARSEVIEAGGMEENKISLCDHCADSLWRITNL